MLSSPHGGTLINRVVPDEKRDQVLEEARGLLHIGVSRDDAVNLENIAHGVFSPLEGFLCQDDYLSVLENMRLVDDTPWTIPIVLDVDEETAGGISKGDRVALTHEGEVIAILNVEDMYSFDKRLHAEKVFQTTDEAHPGVAKTYSMDDYLLGGKIDFLNRVENEYADYTLRPIDTRVLFKEIGWRTVVGFQTRNSPHLGHEYVQKTALTFIDGLFINPVIGKKKQGDFRDEVILKSYEELIENYYLKDKAVLSIFRTEMHYAGPREAIYHAIARKNYGCTHFIVGRDHAGVGDYYEPYEAQEIFNRFPDLGISPVFFKKFYYCKKCYGYVNERICPHDGDDVVPPSGTRIRGVLREGRVPPKELMRPEVAEIILDFDQPFVE